MKHINLEVYGGAGPRRKPNFGIPDHCSVYQMLLGLEAEGALPKKFGTGEGFSEFLVFVNGTLVPLPERTGRMFSDNDKVVVIAVLAGG
jgi:sulfur carrier protein ThiS